MNNQINTQVSALVLVVSARATICCVGRNARVFAFAIGTAANSSRGVGVGWGGSSPSCAVCWGQPFQCFRLDAVNFSRCVLGHVHGLELRFAHIPQTARLLLLRLACVSLPPLLACWQREPAETVDALHQHFSASSQNNAVRAGAA